MDVIVDQAYAVARGAYAFTLGFQEYSAQKFPYGPVVVLVAHCINGSMAVHAANKDKPTLYWLHSLVVTVLGGFGGGIITPVILGAKPSVIFANDLVLPIACLIWYLTNYCGFDKVFAFKPVKLLWNVVVTLWRTNACVNAVTLGVTVLKPGPYYPTPLMGPIIGGTLINSLGAFVPFDKGLTPISKGTPWPIQSAFLTSCLFFFVLKDREGFMGIALRSVVGDLSQRVVVGIMTGFQVITLASQVLFDDPSANFLTPLYSVLYVLFGVQGPPAATSATATTPVPMTIPLPTKSVSGASVSSSGVTGTVHSDSIATNTDTNTTTTSTNTNVATTAKKAKFSFYHFTLLLRTTAVALIVFYQLSLRIPPTTISAVKASVYSVNDVPFVTLNTIHMNRLSGDAAISVCQYVQFLYYLPVVNTLCKPYALRLEQVSVCNGECSIPAECTAYGSRSACESSRGAVSGLSGNKLLSSGVRLAVYDAAGAHFSMPYHTFTTSTNNNTAANTSTVWTAALPTTYTTASALTSIDPHYKFANVELYLTTSSEVFLVYNTQFSGSIFNVYRLSGRVLWSGVNSVTCANKDGSGGSTVEATALYLDEVSGTPRIRCSDGGSVELDISTVHKTEVVSTITNTVATPVTSTNTNTGSTTTTSTTNTATPSERENTSTDTPAHTTLPIVQTTASVKSEL